MSRRAEVIALAALAGLSYALFLLRAGDVGYWFDELWSVDAVSGSFAAMLDRVGGDVHPPGYHALLWAWVRAFGASEFATHALSALLVSATVPFVYGLGRRLGLGPQAALAAAAFSGLGYASINYALETRPYALLLFVTTVALWAAAGEFTWRRFAAAAAAGAVGLYSHYGILFTAVPGVVLLALARRERRWLLLLPAWGLVFLPWAARLATQAGRFRQMGWLTAPSVESALHQLTFFAGSPWGRGLSAALAIAAVVIAARRRTLRDAWLLLFPGVFTGLFVVSVAATPLFHQRYLLPLVPWYALTIAYVVDRLPAARLRAGAAGVVAAAAALSAQHYFVAKAEDWRAPARHVLERRAGASVVTVESSIYFRHYVPDVAVFADGDAAAVRRWLAARPGQTVWLLQARDFAATPATAALAEGTEVLEINDFAGTRALKLRTPP